MTWTKILNKQQSKKYPNKTKVFAFFVSTKSSPQMKCIQLCYLSFLTLNGQQLRFYITLRHNLITPLVSFMHCLMVRKFIVFYRCLMSLLQHILITWYFFVGASNWLELWKSFKVRMTAKNNNDMDKQIFCDNCVRYQEAENISSK